MIHSLFRSGKRWETITGDPYDHCVICGARTTSNATLMFVDIRSNEFVLPSDRDPTDSEVASWPVGSECIKKHPEVVPYLAPKGTLAF